jgi:dihydrofolate reductase
MTKLRVHSFSLSLDGYGAGPDQDLEHPLGVGGPELFESFFATRTWRAMHGQEGGDTGPDEDAAQRGFQNIGAWILGRNMFGPVRGPWPDESWRGWWGEEPPYHVPAFVLSRGEHLFFGLDLRALGYECVKHEPGRRAAAHVVLAKRA